MGAGASLSLFAARRDPDLQQLIDDTADDSIRWVVIGSADSGRRTLSKHLDVEVSQARSREDLGTEYAAAAPQMRVMVLRQLQILARLAEEELGYEFGTDTSIRADLEMLQEMKMTPIDRRWSPDECSMLLRVWCHGAMQAAYSDRGVANMSDEVKIGLARKIDESLAFFCEPQRLRDLGSSTGWLPSFSECLKFPTPSNIGGVRDQQLVVGMGVGEGDEKMQAIGDVSPEEATASSMSAGKVVINLTTLLSVPNVKWVSKLSDGAASLIMFTIAMPTLPLGPGGTINAVDQVRLKAARSIFASTINSPSLELVPLVLVMTKMDQCQLEAHQIETLLSSFMACSERKLGIKVFLVDATDTGRVKALFRSLIRATLSLGSVAAELREMKWEEERERRRRASKRRRKRT